MGEMGSHSRTPVVVLKGESLKAGSASWVAASTAIRHALEEHGFFIAEYDRLPLQLHQAFLSDTDQLFQLPYETKIKNTSDKIGHGYIGSITGTPHEGLGIDDATDPHNITDFSKLMWPHSGNHRFSENANRYAEILLELKETVERMLFESYGLGKEVCDDHVGAATYLLRFLKYTKPENDEERVEFLTHTDKGFISILHQNHVPGLELQLSDGNWVGYHPSPTSFVVLAGDACMAWSNERVKSSYHRVVIERNQEIRYSIGFFSFQTKKVIETPKELVDEDHPLKYKPLDHLGLLKFYLTADIGIRNTHHIARAYCGTN